ncbi:hypothetical protein OJ997_35430 [Solirubrobacter phytolaccae]|uniref:Uncharacterized protein n=1 Tax=Solirubrobacter phytolaccae TaxID=1404360 RepID=A0A9X3NQX4_9ACTN|nr:hypothetical protein [Solirubrobacter phytolaccae]MDA0185652.1 hypothetical protein [Solirubrobacter phytolaccae]
MGLLDDAIREHLELKRKHGANPDDVARQEREALGPSPRNEFAQTEEPEAEAIAPAVPEPEVSAPEPAAGEPDPEPAPPHQEAPPEPQQPEPGYEEDPWLADERDEVPAEEALESKPGSDEDVLEETPEFLQETPEHDRLWFEQKPPKDFDWDK